MKNEFIISQFKNIILQQDLYKLSYTMPSTPMYEPAMVEQMQANIPNLLEPLNVGERALSEVLFITTYPPKECGIATYSQDLIKALNTKYDQSFAIKVCALETENEKYDYPENPSYILETTNPASYIETADKINQNPLIEIVVVQHEFGLFKGNENEFAAFLRALKKPVVMAFHTVLPHPDPLFRDSVNELIELSEAVVVMTMNSEKILKEDYNIEPNKISVIPHGTHLVPHLDKNVLKEKYGLTGRQVLSTFGLLSSGKSIETTLEAMPDIIRSHPDVIFLVIGKTHPSVSRSEGEKYRGMLEAKVAELQLKAYVRFINFYLPLNELLEYLQLTDIYLFTSIDPNQAVSGTFSYALSCGCPIISTPIPHAKEVLKNDLGLIVDFRNSKQLGDAVVHLLDDEERRNNISLNGLHTMASTAWENSAIKHAMLFNDISSENIITHYNLPPVNLDHIKKMTTDFGMIQFSKINQPDISSGYTIDDNARALIAMCQHYELSGDVKDLKYIYIYFTFIQHCLQSEGYFLNYVSGDNQFTSQNQTANLADANGRAIWALGYMISIGHLLPMDLRENGEATLNLVLNNLNTMHSTRAMGFAIKGLYYSNITMKSQKHSAIISALANRLLQMYKHESDDNWKWFESYLTYANSVLPEAMLCAYIDSGDPAFRDIAKSSFDFLLKHIFIDNRIRVISNKSWMQRGEKPSNFGEQPIDVGYTILALGKFYEVFMQEDYLVKMETAFNWFLGNNHLHQTIYNPCTGGCYDGLEEKHVNLNQGAESSVSYLMARLTMEKYNMHMMRLKQPSNRDFAYN